jgi:hypothetical protein
MAKYVVSCYEPPGQFEVKKGDRVKIEGWLNKDSDNIRAEMIQTPADDGPVYECGIPQLDKFAKGLPRLVTMKGAVTQVIYTPDAVQFEIETEE